MAASGTAERITAHDHENRGGDAIMEDCKK